MQRPVSTLSPDALQEWLNSVGELNYRSQQIIKWVHQGQVAGWNQMSNLPASLQKLLNIDFKFSTVNIEQQQGILQTTQKFLWRLEDNQLVESVLIPANTSLYGETSDRYTLCVSTQVGCAYGCRFCASGLEGFKRNLKAAEIVDQVLSVERMQQGQRANHSRLITNLVIMGMGEPLANYPNLMSALEILNAQWGANIGARKITISTSGLAPQIRKLAKESPQYRLAVSLHGATNEIRNKLMPVNKKYPLGELIAAIEEYQSSKNGMITLEYILIAGLNDNLSQALALGEIAKRLRAKLNLIPYNEVDEFQWERPRQSTQDAFLNKLIKLGVPATLRREKGHDIDAACGQLRLRTEKELDANRS